MAFDFPASPAEGQKYSPVGGPSYVYSSGAWKAAGQGQIAIISDTPPANPANGTLWWESDTGLLFISYNDGNSTQWVQVGGNAAAGRIVRTIVTSSSTYTKPDGLQFLEIEVQGGGAASGGCAATTTSQQSVGGGGGGGGYSTSFLAAADVPAVVAMTVGAAGLGVSAATGGNAGASHFGSLGSGNGGTGGNTSGVSAAQAYVSPGNGGVASNGQSNITGQGGGSSSTFFSGSFSMAGAGGSSMLGHGGPMISAGNWSEVNGTGYGAGARSGGNSGASQAAKAGGNGSPGVIILTEYF